MKKKAIIVETLGEYAFAVTDKESACGGNCAGCSMCNLSGEKKIKVLNEASAKPGEEVYIYLSTFKFLFLSFLTYIMPIITFFVCYAIVKDEVISVVLFLTSFFVFSFISNKIAKTKKFITKCVKAR